MKLNVGDVSLLIGIREEQECTKLNPCPRCGQDILHDLIIFNSLSRIDNKTYICTACGREESYDLKRNLPMFLIEHWWKVKVREMLANEPIEWSEK